VTPAQVAAIDLVSASVRLLGLAILAAAVAAAVAAIYRWYVKARVPVGLAVLGGLAIVAIYLNTSTALGQVIGGARGLLDLETAMVNITVFVVAAVASYGGNLLGDRLAREFALAGAGEFEEDVGRLVRAVGRAIVVTLPDEIEDIEGYEPVAEATKTDLAGKSFVFPRGLTVDQLRERLITRLREDHGVGHVGVDLARDGTVDYLALGSRAAGLGPTLAPGMAATAIRGDPPNAASAGDTVQVWSTGPAPSRLLTAELRAAVDDVVTLAADLADIDPLDPDERYRLVTLPAEARVDREFASLLRTADETMDVVTIAEGSPLAGAPVGALDLAVIARRPAGGAIEAIPGRSTVMAASDTLYALGRPEALRRLQAVAEAESSS